MTKVVHPPPSLGGRGVGHPVRVRVMMTTRRPAIIDRVIIPMAVSLIFIFLFMLLAPSKLVGDESRFEGGYLSPRWACNNCRISGDSNLGDDG
jgi:hypothetical protein